MADFSHNSLRRGFDMKVLVHLNQRVHKSYMLSFGAGIQREEIRNIVEADHETSIQRLIAKSQDIVEVPAGQKQIAIHTADFSVSQNGYSQERLA